MHELYKYVFVLHICLSIYSPSSFIFLIRVNLNPAERLRCSKLIKKIIFVMHELYKHVFVLHICLSIYFPSPFLSLIRRIPKRREWRGRPIVCAV